MDDILEGQGIVVHDDVLDVDKDKAEGMAFNAYGTVVGNYWHAKEDAREDDVEVVEVRIEDEVLEIIRKVVRHYNYHEMKRIRGLVDSIDFI